MKSSTRTARSFLTGLLCTLWCSSPVWGDDTEIFFGAVGDANARPNVLFIIDTSGSMSGDVAGTGKDRLDNVKDAMYQLLDELNGVNVGLMRFTNPGGPILYPVRDIDEEVNSGSIVNTDTPIQRGTDDAQELTSTGAVVLDAPRLQIIELTGSVDSFEDQISDDDHDAEEDDGEMDLDSGDLDFDREKLIGVRFSGSDVPDGAVITNAYMRFTGDGGGDSNILTYRISGEAKDTGSFDDNDDDISSRTQTSAFVDWTITSSVVADQTIDTPDLTAIVQEIVDHPSWDPDGGSEDDMTFVLEPHPDNAGTGRRDFYTRDDSTSRAARLFIEYYVGSAPASSPSIVGLRFDGANIPRGVTVTDAYVVFTANQDFSSTYDLTIGIESSGNTSTYTDSANSISGRSYEAATVDWSGSLLDVSTGDTFQTPDISDIIEDITDRNDWCGGNALSLVIRGSTGALASSAFEDSASLAPRLIVKYEYDTIQPGASCFQRVVSKTITSSSDDAEENGDSVSTTSGDLDFFSGNVVGMRFADMTIPRDADISAAYIELTADNNDDGTTEMSIRIEATDDAATYGTTDGAIEDRNYLATTVSWTESEDWVLSDLRPSPDLTQLVSTITSRVGWNSGQAIAFRIDTSTATDREAETVDGSPGQAPRLVVAFEDDGSGLTSRRTRDVLADLVSQLNHNGWTPIQDTLYEAARYYTDQNVLWGATRGDANIDGGPFSYTRVSAAESMVDGTYSINRPAGCSENNLDDSDCINENISGLGTGPTYDSPIDDFCQEQSHIILLTDGQANRPHSTDLIPGFIGGACANEPTVNADGTTTNLTGGELCVKDLAKYMNESDLRPTLQGNQRVTTHTIGFNFSSQWLEDVATEGGGEYKTADNATELVAEIKDIIGEVLKTDSTFVAPVATVNAFTRLSHLRQVYFAVFRPDEFPRWRGNLKKYSFGETGSSVLDANDNLAVDPNTGFFSATSRSFWSSDVDGALVDLGGAAENVPAYASRNLFTYYEGSTSTTLSNSVNAVDSTNTNLTAEMFGIGGASSAELAELIDWTRGKDVDDENGDESTLDTRYIFGDPLHSEPVAVTYGGTEENPDVTVFMGTNAGTLQAINAGNGQETFAFMPEALLPMQKDLRANLSTTSHPYGIDGSVTAWVNDAARDGISDSDSEDFVRIYAGMRRGGQNYYALDATNRATPRLMWQITGGTIQSNGDDFRELGQTWSQPIRTRIKLSGDTEPRDVLLFSAGYDEDQDNAQVQTADNVGRGMYIIDALTGRLIWSGGKTDAQTWNESYGDMDFSFPSTPSVADVDRDGLADMWFIGDTGGQLWRFDIRNGEAVEDLVTGGVIADLGVADGTNTIEENRRFFVSPSISLQRGADGLELAVVIGSGMRPSPLSTLANNRLFMVRQQAVYGAPSSYVAVTSSTLYNATPNELVTGTDEDILAAEAALSSSDGWYLDFINTGEKMFSNPTVFDGEILIVTYTPGDSGIWCRPAAGTSRSYSVGVSGGQITQPPLTLLTPSIVSDTTVFFLADNVGDDDGISTELPGDEDDGYYEDYDRTGDGVFSSADCKPSEDCDALIAQCDTNTDGQCDTTDCDTDGDGICDGDECTGGSCNYCDTDDDGDCDSNDGTGLCSSGTSVVPYQGPLARGDLELCNDSVKFYWSKEK